MSYKISLVVFLFMLNCKQSTIINGVVRIKIVDLGSLYGSSEEQINVLSEQVKVFDASKATQAEQSYYSYYKFLLNNNLIDKPCFLLTTDNGMKIRVFSSVSEYKKVEELLINLDKSREQIQVSFKGKHISDIIYYADSIMKCKKVKGKTEWQK